MCLWTIACLQDQRMQYVHVKLELMLIDSEEKTVHNCHACMCMIADVMCMTGRTACVFRVSFMHMLTHVTCMLIIVLWTHKRSARPSLATSRGHGHGHSSALSTIKHKGHESATAPPLHEHER